jgi:hypothetical protein
MLAGTTHSRGDRRIWKESVVHADFGARGYMADPIEGGGPVLYQIDSEINSRGAVAVPRDASYIIA